jgi:hypothetical protein
LTRRLACALAILAALPAAAETLDRIAVTVDREAITESDVIRELRVAAFLDQKPVEITGPLKRRAAERLVDQILILREAAESHLPMPTEAEARVLVDQIKRTYPSEDVFDAELERHDVSKRDLLAHMLAGLRASVFTDLRFRPGVSISEEDARAYYEENVRKRLGARAPSFEESRVEIEDLLAGQRVLDALDAWLESARAAARIEYKDKVFQ